MILTVTRKWFSPVSTCGMMEIDGVFFAYTLERQKYAEGMEKPYSVPLGTYGILLLPSYHFSQTRPSWYRGTVPHLDGVPGFTGCEIHPANWPSQLLGCTAVGSVHYEDYPDPTSGVRGGAVLGSDAKFLQLMERLQGTTDPISITYQEEV